MTLANSVNPVPLHIALERIREAPTLEATVETTGAAVCALGFEKFALFEWNGPHGVCSVHHNSPGAWSDSHESLTLHPTIRRAMSSPLPFAWDREFFAASNALALWERQASRGLSAGLCTAYGPHDKRACIVVAAQADSQAPSGQEMYDLFGPLLLISGQYYSALERVKPAVSGPSVRLRPREVECLHWVLHGKTAWETSKILGISERTVNQHLARARQQLGTASSNVAAAKALQLQLLPRPHAA